jgi:hypothetical protein
MAWPERLADHVKLALERIGHGDVGAAPMKTWRMTGSMALTDSPRSGCRDGHVAPTEQYLALVHASHARSPARKRGARQAPGQENHPDTVLAHGREADRPAREFFAKETVRNLDQDPGAVALQRVGANGAAVRQILQDLEALLDDFMRLLALDVGDEADAAGVVFIGGVVKTLLQGKIHQFPRHNGTPASNASGQAPDASPAGESPRPIRLSAPAPRNSRPARRVIPTRRPFKHIGRGLDITPHVVRVLQPCCAASIAGEIDQ